MWIGWTLLEATTKACSKALQKIIGMTGESFTHILWATVIVGMVQVLLSLTVMMILKKSSVFVDQKGVGGSVLFGLFAVLATVLSFMAFQHGGKVGVNTFIMTLSIMPGTMIDRIFFGRQLSYRQWLGVAIAIMAGYFSINCPSLQEITVLPLWIWLSVGAMLAVTLNQGITQSIASTKIDPLTKNFWGGLTTIVLAGIFLFPLSVSDFPPISLVASSIIVGIIVTLMWSFNLLAYKKGAYIALKKLVMNGCYLTLAMIIGLVLYGERIELLEVLGVFLFIIAFVFLDDNTWRFIFMRRQ